VIVVTCSFQLKSFIEVRTNKLQYAEVGIVIGLSNGLMAASLPLYKINCNISYIVTVKEA
jgi:hypothetical protein